MSTQERYTTEATGVATLGESITLPSSGLIAKSRFMKAAMSERMSSFDMKDPSERGIPSENMIHLYEEWGKGGWGIILSQYKLTFSNHCAHIAFQLETS